MKEEIIFAREQIQKMLSLTGWSATSLAQRAGVDPSTLTRLMGKKPTSAPTMATMHKLSEAVRAHRPASDADAYPAPATHYPIDVPKGAPCPKGMVCIPEFEISASAGSGLDVPNIQAPQHHWQIPRSFLRGLRVQDLNQLAILIVEGDSMEPDYTPGDRVLIDRGYTQITHDGVYVLGTPHGLLLKQLQLSPSKSDPKVRVISLNPTYPPSEMPYDDITVAGRVVGKWVWK